MDIVNIFICASLFSLAPGKFTYLWVKQFPKFYLLHIVINICQDINQQNLNKRPTEINNSLFTGKKVALFHRGRTPVILLVERTKTNNVRMFIKLKKCMFCRLIPNFLSNAEDLQKVNKHTKSALSSYTRTPLCNIENII